ncbi:MAG: ABC transporter ATP-binding protein [Rhodospirillaceae bacterium]|jgi:branched-chain amino acid transport system ATP-binding protein|nr:ABC transporter ATP-binding protein [Rhodospirillaceae bacterium]
MNASILSTKDLSINFGGLRAVHNLSVSVDMGEVHAIIGPNGAGKTTMINLLSGDLLPSSGQVFHRGQDITSLPAHRVAKRGIGRSYQITNIFPEFTCRENCWLAARSRRETAMRFFLPSGRDRGTAALTEKTLEMTGLSAQADVPAQAMSYGEQRQLEIAMLLALEPEVLLLDEPLAGLGPNESVAVIDLIRRLAPDHAIVLIEHDMDAVFSIADRLTVMVNGEMLESGEPAQIRASDKVRQAYLGDELELEVGQ